jgi:hypothetical protein
LAFALVLEDDRLLRQFGHPLGNGAKGESGILSFWSTQVRADGDSCSRIDQTLQRRQRSLDPKGVPNRSPIKGDVEVGANEHREPVDIDVVQGQIR